MEHEEPKPSLKVSDAERLAHLRQSLAEADRRAEDVSDRGYVSYEDAYQKELSRLGINDEDLAFVAAGGAPKTTETEKPSEVKIEVGPSVELGARALALHNIMQTLNHANKTRGATITRQYADNDFDRRYGITADDVQDGMIQKTSRMLGANEADFDVLTATDDMIAAGFPAEDVARMKARLKYDIVKAYGPGQAIAKDRARVVNRAAAAARAGNRKSKP